MAIMSVKRMLWKDLQGYTEITQKPHAKCLERDYTSLQVYQETANACVASYTNKLHEESHGRMLFMWVARLRIGKDCSKDTIHLEPIVSDRQKCARCGRRNVSNRSSAQRGWVSLSSL